MVFEQRRRREGLLAVRTATYFGFVLERDVEPLPWFEARYGLALAYYRSQRAREAAKLIDATAILHPDLGGGELRDKFLRLRQRIGPDQ